MKNKFQLYTCIISLILCSCSRNSDKQIEFEIVDFKENDIGNALYSVYAPDTNWIKMEEFAKKLIQDKGTYSSVAFFCPKENTPKFKENNAIPGDAIKYMTGNYRYDEGKGKFRLYKNQN